MRRLGIAPIAASRVRGLARTAAGGLLAAGLAVAGWYAAGWLLDRPAVGADDDAPPAASSEDRAAAPAPTTKASRIESLDERRRRVAEMTDEQFEELRRKREVFEGLSADKQEQLRELQRQIDESENAEELRETMRRYSAWLRTLPAGRRAELASLPTEERLAQVRQLLEQQRREQEQRMPRPPGRSLKGDDAKVLTQWLDELVTTHETEIAAMIPSGPFWDRFRQVSDPQRRRASLMFTLSRRVSEGGTPLEFPTDDEYARLAAALSPPARQELEAQKTRKEKGELVFEWARTQFFNQFQTPQPPQPTREELEKYFREEVNANDRAWLEGLPPERFARELRRHYQMHVMRRAMESQRGGGAGKPGGPGPLGKPLGGRGPGAKPDETP